MKDYLKTSTVMAASAAIAFFASSASALVIADYDKDHNGTIDSHEFIDYTFDIIDKNDDEHIDVLEWDSYKHTFYMPYNDMRHRVGMTMDTYDHDDDRRLNIAEYSDVADTDLFNKWDTNNDAELSYSEVTDAEELYRAYSAKSAYYDF